MGHREAMPLKPDPTTVLEVAETLGFEPQRIAYVGDTAIDMQTARRAGMFAVGVTWGFRDRQELQEHGSDAVIGRPEELPILLQ